MQYVIAFAATAIVFLVLDMIWLGVVAKDFYQGEIGGLLRANPNLGAAVAFYLLYVAGVVFFAVAPALDGGGFWRALLVGALLGLFAYGTYDLTNLATLEGFTRRMAMIDLAWGTVLTASAASGGYLAAARFAG